MALICFVSLARRSGTRQLGRLMGGGTRLQAVQEPPLSNDWGNLWYFLHSTMISPRKRMLYPEPWPAGLGREDPAAYCRGQGGGVFA